MPQEPGGPGGEDGGGGDGGDTSGGGPTGFHLDLGGTGSSSSSSSGSSSGGSSSGGGSSAAAAPIDPNVTQGIRDYYEIWSTMPPFGYIEGLVKQGLNHFEIVEHELAKPRAQTTSFYRDKFAYYANTAARIFGRR